MDENPHATLEGTLGRSCEGLLRLRGELTGFLSGSEEGFLETGRRLTDLEARARALLRTARTAATLGAAEGDQTPTERIGTGLGRLDRHFHCSGDAFGAALRGLSQVLTGVEEIARQRNDFEDIQRTLRMLGLNTRIENARSSGDNSGMETVGIEVRRLGELIGPRFREILERARSVRETATRARIATDTFLERHGTLSDKIVGETRGALEALQTATASGREMVSKGLAASERLVPAMTEILVALQSHDATRQILEHVIEEIEAFDEDVASASRAGGLDAGAWLSEAATVCQILSAQVRGGREALGRALNRIVELLRATGRQVEELARESERLVGTGATGSPVEQVRMAVERAARAMALHSSHEQETVTALRGVAETIRGMATFALQIQKIGQSVKIISLNALVETERAGEVGEVLAVLAQGMGALAVDVVDRTRRVSLKLREIAAAVEELETSSKVGTQASESLTIATDMRELVRLLENQHDAVQASVTALKEHGPVFRSEIDEIAERLNRETRTLETLREIERQLARLADEAARSAGPERRGPCPGRRPSVFSRYTMESEREMHRRALGQPDGSVRDASSGGGDSTHTGSEFGSNVELF